MGSGEELPSRRSFLDKLQKYHIPAFVGGSTLIIFLTVLNIGVQDSVGLQLVGEEFVTPARIALVGLGTGYYLGDGLKQNSTDIIAFHIGAFLALLLGTVRLAPAAPEIAILGTASLFALSINVSSLVDSYRGISDAFDLLARDVPRGGIIFVFSVQYLFSFYFWAGPQVDELSIPQQIVVVIVLLIILFISYTIAKYVSTWKSEDDSIKSPN